MQDLVLFIATPVLILPAFAAARTHFSIQEIAIFVAAFGALGHHFPGMLRAYGDRDLFEKFKVRFIASPIFFVGVASLFAFYDLGGVILVAALWGVWHGLAQTYGFLRIYDAKAGSVGKWTAKLDLQMCIAWFGAGVFLSPTRSYDLLHRLYGRIGIPALPEGLWTFVRQGWAVWTAIVTVAFLVHFVRCRLVGKPQSNLKLFLMFTSFGFWIYASLAVKSLLVGVALFEIFHDVQYLSIVWYFNRNRAEQGSPLGSFARFLFRKSGLLVALYVGLVFAYGSLAFVQSGLSIEPLMGGLEGVLVASALLHFYYDGFIWKMRDRSTSAALGVKDGGVAGFRFASWAQHGAKWSVLAFALVLLGWTEVSREGKVSDLRVAEALVGSVPDSADAHLEHGRALAEAQRHEDARDAYRKSLAIRSNDAETHNNLALSLAALGDTEGELDHLEQAVAIDPKFGEAHNNLGVALMAQDRRADARGHFERAIELDADDALAHVNLGRILVDAGELEDAITHFQRARELEPGLEWIDRAIERLESHLARTARS